MRNMLTREMVFEGVMNGDGQTVCLNKGDVVVPPVCYTMVTGEKVVVKEIEDFCFMNTDVTSVVVPEGVKIPANAFLGCCEKMDKDKLSNLIESRFSENEEVYQKKILSEISDFKALAAAPFIRKYKINDERRKKLAAYLFGGELIRFIDWTIARGEGFREDKTDFVVKKIKEYLITGQNQNLYVEREGLQTYWSPRSFKDTDDVIEQFFAWWCLLIE